MTPEEGFCLLFLFGVIESPIKMENWLNGLLSFCVLFLFGVIESTRERALVALQRF